MVSNCSVQVVANKEDLQADYLYPNISNSLVNCEADNIGY